MGEIIFVLGCLLSAVLSFYVVYSNKFPRIKLLLYAMLAYSVINIAILWLQFFFPEMSWEGTLSGFDAQMAFWGKTCLVFFVVWGFFLWIYLDSKNGYFFLNKITKKISKTVVILSSIVIVVISIGSIIIRLTV